MGSGSDGIAQPDAQPSTSYKIVYAAQSAGLSAWRSTTGDVASLSAGPSWVSGLTCTYDGRFLAVGDARKETFDVLDGSGAVVRSQQGLPMAIRPDGKRVLVSRSDPTPNEICVGTLDEDGAYGNVRCFSTMGETFGAVAYAPDGKTVLWSHGIFDPSTTATSVSLETAFEDGTNRRVIVPAPTPPATGGVPFIQSASFNFDGTQVAYVTCTQIYGSDYCDFHIVQLDTLETTTIGFKRPFRGVGFTPDGKSLLSLEPTSPDGNEPRGPWALRLVDIETQAASTLVDPTNAAFYAPSLCVARDP